MEYPPPSDFQTLLQPCSIHIELAGHQQVDLRHTSLFGLFLKQHSVRQSTDIFFKNSKVSTMYIFLKKLQYIDVLLNWQNSAHCSKTKKLYQGLAKTFIILNEWLRVTPLCYRYFCLQKANILDLF